MARPKDADSAETWNRIVNAARRELFETPGGQTEVSMRQVAAAAGVGVGTIQYYFPTKESLLEACLDAYYLALDAIVRELSAAAASTVDPRGFIEEAVRRLYRFVVSERPHLMVRAKTNAQRGGLPPERRGDLQQLGRLLSPLLGIDSEETALTIQTMSAVMMQYAVLGDDDVVRTTGRSGAEGRRILEDHTVRVALRLAFPGSR